MAANTNAGIDRRPARMKAGSIRSRQRVSERALFSAFSRTWGIFQSSPGARHSLGSPRKLEQPENRTGISQAARQHNRPAPNRSTAAKPPARIRALPQPLNSFTRSDII